MSSHVNLNNTLVEQAGNLIQTANVEINNLQNLLQIQFLQLLGIPTKTPMSIVLYNTLKAHSGLPQVPGTDIKDGKVVNLDELPITKFVSVQPLDGPVALVYYMKYQQDSESGKMVSLEIVSEPVVAASYKIQMDDTVGVENIIFAAVKQLSTQSLDTLDAKYQNATFLVNKVANQIGVATKRGFGNKLLANGDTLETLKKYLDKETLDRFTLLPCSVVPNNEVYVGYVGPSQVDAGIIFSPYMFMPNHFRCGMHTRGQSSDYYHHIKFSE